MLIKKHNCTKTSAEECFLNNSTKTHSSRVRLFSVFLPAKKNHPVLFHLECVATWGPQRSIRSDYYRFRIVLPQRRLERVRVSFNFSTFVIRLNGYFCQPNTWLQCFNVDSLSRNESEDCIQPVIDFLVKVKNNFTEKTLWRRVFLTIWHCILNADPTKTHSSGVAFLVNFSVWRSVFLCIWHFILNADSTKTHSSEGTVDSLSRQEK